jgi:hypothetical protein
LIFDYSTASRELDDSRDDDDQDFRRKATEVLPDTEQDELDEKTPLGVRNLPCLFCSDDPCCRLVV